MKQGKTIIILSVCLFVLLNFMSCVKSDTREEQPPSTPCSGTPGPLFTAVKTLMTAKCVNCHNSTTSNGGMNFSVECNIVTNKARIKVRAVDEGTMPPTGALPQADKTAITNWINAGGKYTD